MMETEPSMVQKSDRKLTDMDKQTDAEIAKGLRQGCRDAWLKLYDLYADKLWHNVARLMGDDQTSVADIVQETFLAAARSAGNFDPRRGCLWIWLWAIAKRQVALHYRKCQPRSALAQAQGWWTSLNGKKDDWLQGTEKPPAEVLESRELAELVRYALGELPAEYQVLLMAKYVDGAAVREIADQVNGSSIAVRSKLARARKAFRGVFNRLTHRPSDMQEVAL
jgi:RNA polymerase sigma-70 factor (ECF subfamily)